MVVQPASALHVATHQASQDISIMPSTYTACNLLFSQGKKMR
jgi:hypothetical protein